MGYEEIGLIDFTGEVKMDAITKESKEWLAALTLVPEKWQAGRCKVTDVTCRHFDRSWFDPESEESKRWVKEGGEHPPFAEHDIPPPDITPDLLYAIRESLKARKYSYCLEGHVSGEYEFRIFDENNESAQIADSEICQSEADAIIRAAASLQEAK